MTSWKKSPPELIAAFYAALPTNGSITQGQMFGYPCAFVHGRMAVGLHEDRLIARVPAEAVRHPCVILGRTMKDYVAIDDAIRLDPHMLRDWIGRAIAFTATLPPKAAKELRPRQSGRASTQPSTTPPTTRGRPRRKRS